MIGPVSCPTLDELKQLLLGQASETDTDRWATHFEDCERCVEAIRTLTPEADDTLLSALAQSEHDRAVEADANVSRLIDRIKSLGRLEERSSPNATLRVDVDQSDRDADCEISCEFLSAALAPDELGRLGEYRVLRLLGAGGMGIVFEAEDTRLRRRVALKVIKPELNVGSSARQRFLREAQSAAAIEHDNIVTVYQVGEERSIPFLAMQLLRGETLLQRLSRAKRLPVQQLLRIGREIAEGLGAAHAHGLLHRDIKPGNVFLSMSQGFTDKVKLLDFGLARDAG